MAFKTERSKAFEKDIRIELRVKLALFIKLDDFGERWGGEPTKDLIKTLYSCILRQNSLLKEIDQIRRNPKFRSEEILKKKKEDLNFDIGIIENDEEQAIKQLTSMYGGWFQVKTVETPDGKKIIPKPVKKVFIGELEDYLKLTETAYTESIGMIENLEYSP